MLANARKFALVIGNGAYSGDFHLDSPPFDAAAVTSSLITLGFDVTSAINLTFDRMNNTINEFSTKVKSATRVDTLLFYFSGHGIARQRENYIVPIDFDEPGSRSAKFIRVQSVIDQLSSIRNGQFVKIVLLDACRSGDTDEEGTRYEQKIESALEGKSVVTSEGDEGMFVNGIVKSKFTTMTGGQNTFIAFATAEGRAAYGVKGSSLSLFTAALVKNIYGVDLPLTNLMSRVRIEVLEQTKQEQNTWDQSSLNEPFFFNPGSLLMFNGNAMALVGLFLSLIPYSLLLTTDKSWIWVATAGMLPIISLSIMLFGMQSAYSRLKGSFDAGKEAVYTVREHIVTSFQKGIVGGYLGSLVAGLGIGIPYYIAWSTIQTGNPDLYDPLEPLGAILLEITVATALTSGVLGFFCLLCTRLGWKNWGAIIAANASDWRVVVGAMVGGMLSGLIAGPILTIYFGLKSRPDMSPNLLIPGSMLGTGFIIFSIINFDFERLTLRRIWTGAAAAALSLLVGLFAAFVIMGFFYWIGAVKADTDFLHNHAQEYWALALGGAIYGVPVGAILGSIIGAAIVLTTRFSGASVLTAH